MTEQQEQAAATPSPPETDAATSIPAEPAVVQKPAPKPAAAKKRSPPARKAVVKPATKPKPLAADNAPDLNTKDFPLHPERIWPD